MKDEELPTQNSDEPIFNLIKYKDWGTSFDVHVVQGYGYNSDFGLYATSTKTLLSIN